jgi:hypothetical protein
MMTLAGDPAKTKPANPIAEQTIADTKKYVFWGDSNDLPTMVINEMGKNEILYRANEFNKDVHFGGGLSYYREIKKDGQRYIEFFDDAEINDWFEANEAQLLYKALVNDYETLGNVFPEMLLTANRKRIARLFRHDASWCRWAKQDKSSREVKTLFVNSDWSQDKETYTEDIPALNSRFPLEDLQSRNSGYNFAYRIRPVSNGRYYYEMCNTEVLINSTTLEIQADIKRTMRAMLKNQATILWHIEITEEYLETRYGKTEWLKIKDDTTRKTKALQEVKADIDKYLAGADNAGKTLLSGCYYDKAGNKISGVHISPLKNQIEKGQWIPDQQQLANEIFMGMGVDPSAVGGFSNQNRTMNSGSEKKNSFQISNSTFASDQMITLAPFAFVARYNGWFKRIPGLKFGVIPPSDQLSFQPTTTTQNEPAS